MEPNIKTAFKQILCHLDSIDERCGRMEKGAVDSERAQEVRNAAVEVHITQLEKGAADSERARGERDAAVEIHVGQLEKAVGTQASSSSMAIIQV